MRVVFAGTPEFAATALAALLDGGFEIPLVLTQPDRPAGRGQKVVASPVAQLAHARRLTVAAPATLNLKKGGTPAQAAHAQIQGALADVLVVAAYGLILPPEILAAPRGVLVANAPPLTALNIHASLLPRWRGAAPIARAIEAGDRETGITIMQMEAGLDSGPMLLTQATAIADEDTSATLSQRLSEIGARLIVQVLQSPARLVPQPQPAQGATYARKVTKLEAWLDFTQPADLLARRVRAFNPFPIAAATVHSVPVKFWRAHSVGRELASQAPGERFARDSAPAGTVRAANADGVRIACGQGDLVVTELQRPGGRRLSARDFLSGFPLTAGDVLAPPPSLAVPLRDGES
jgi:methionyl-tRNA formyltransferase